MKIAVISDIHGNLDALDAVLADIARRGADLTVNLGDLLSGPLWPAETAHRLMALDLPTIRGNHERQLLTLPPERMGASDAFAALQIGMEHCSWLASLPPNLRIGSDVLLVHGTPDSDLDYFLETVDETGCRPATGAEVEQKARGVDARLILCGHTHLQRIMTLADGRVIVNPGSVGLPAYEDDRPWPHVVGSGSPHARYAMAQLTSHGWAVEFVSCEYDWMSAADLAAQNGRPDWARALATGRA